MCLKDYHRFVQYLDFTFYCSTQASPGNKIFNRISDDVGVPLQNKHFVYSYLRNIFPFQGPYDTDQLVPDRDVQKIKMAAVLQLKINNYILETRISFLHSDNRKNLTRVFIRMCTIVTSSDMTSFIYIGDEKHHLSKWFGKAKK